MYTIANWSLIALAITATGCVDMVDNTQHHKEQTMEEAGSRSIQPPESAVAPDNEMMASTESPLRSGGESSMQADPQDPITAVVGCTGYGCDYQDPSAMGCWTNAQILRTAWIPYSSSYLAKVEGWYSPTCGSQWTRVINWSGSQAYIEAAQGSGGVLYGTVGVNNVPYLGTVTSKMFSAAYALQACGEWGFYWSACSTDY